MQWLINFDRPELLAQVLQAAWANRAQGLLSAGLGFTSLLFYFAAGMQRRAARLVRVPARDR